MFQEGTLFHDCQLTLLLLISQSSLLGSASNLVLQSPAHLPLPQQQLMKIENIQANSVRPSLQLRLSLDILITAKTNVFLHLV